MITFDLDEVRSFVADLDAKLDRCDNGEELACATLDDALRHYAERCCEFCGAVRTWSRAIFAGRLRFDPAVEQAWLDEGNRLLSRAMQMAVYGETAEVPCYELEGRFDLDSGVMGLERLLKGWVTPKLAVGPAARETGVLDPVAAEEIRQRVASLPPLPKDWQPDDPTQRSIYRKLRTS
jgi:hypothetical protein